MDKAIALVKAIARGVKELQIKNVLLYIEDTNPKMVLNRIAIERTRKKEIFYFLSLISLKYCSGE